MRRRERVGVVRRWFPALLLFHGFTAAHAQSTSTLPQVQVSSPAGTQSDDDFVSSVTIHRSEVVKFGAASLIDVLRRVPGVSVTEGRNGQEVRLRGLGAGYTQILVNGVAAPSSLSIDSIPPDSIERIEVMRSASAEYSSQAIAGTINIVLKQAVRRREREFKTGVSSTRGRPSYHLSAQAGEHAGASSLSVALTADRLMGRQHTDVRDSGTFGEMPSLARDGTRERSDAASRFSLVPKATWQLTPVDKLSVEALALHHRIRGSTPERNETRFGDPLLYENSDFFVDYLVRQKRIALSWDSELAGGGKLTTRFVHLREKRDVTSRLLGLDASLQERLDRNVQSEAMDQSTNLVAKYQAPLQRSHDIAAGIEATLARRDEFRLQRDVVALSAAPVDIDEAYDSRVSKLAGYVQDQWQVSPSFGVYLGVRWEGLMTRSSGNVLSPVESSASVFSPIVNAKWKLPDRPDDFIRFSLSRTYKAPTPVELMPRRYIAKNNGPTTPDYQGNPTLRPELAWAADLSYETRDAKGSSFTSNLFTKRISNVIREEVINRGGTWVTRPINGGPASVVGIELDWRTTVDFMEFKPQLRSGLTRAWSRVRELPSPDNNLAQQVPITASVGVDIQPGAHWSFGLSARYAGGSRHRLTISQSSGDNSVVSMDMYAVRKLDGGSSVRLSALNLLGSRQRTTYRYVDEAFLLEQATARKLVPTFRVDVEVKL